jgi:transcriptional regulator with XRE-family HTH domain
VSSASLIRIARRRAGLTQTQLAERLGKSQSEIGRWERGETKPSFETLQRVIRACGLELTVGLANADDSYLSDIDEMLTLSPRERIDHAANLARVMRNMRDTARLA